MNRFSKLAVLVSSVSLSCAAFAATSATTMDITASVAAQCSVSSNGADLGQVFQGQGATTSGTIDVTCSNSTPYNVALNGGLHLQDGGTVRSMQSGSDPIRYQLLKGSGTGGGGVEWGDAGFGGTYIQGTTVTGVGTGVTQQLGFLVQVVNEGVNTYTPGGVYSDTVQITVHF